MYTVTSSTMSLPKLFKCFLFVLLLTIHYVNGNIKPLNPSDNNNKVVLVEENFIRRDQPPVQNTITVTRTKASHFGDFLASRTGYAVSEGGRSLGILTLALIIGIPLIVVLLILFFLPIPVAIGRRTARMAQEVLESDECVERVACEVLRFSRGMEYETAWMQRLLSNDAMNINSNTWIGRISKGVHSPKCTKLTCDPVASLSKTNLFYQKTV